MGGREGSRVGHALLSYKIIKGPEKRRVTKLLKMNWD